MIQTYNISNNIGEIDKKTPQKDQEQILFLLLDRQWCFISFSPVSPPVQVSEQGQHIK